jgi:serine protease Do
VRRPTKRPRRLRGRVLSGGLLLTFAAVAAVPLIAADSTSRTLAPPPVFRKSEPQTLTDVREMETHLVRLIDLAKKSTVQLRVGRQFGSGVIVSEDGLILTAGHVIGEPGRKVDVLLPDGSRVSGTTLGRDRAIDSGMIRINSNRKWEYAELAAADSFRAGSWCLALGHPGGLDEERGVVARFGRVIAARKRFVQSDCELVGGDSGGPLFDMSGRLIAIHSRIGESTNYNFHVPIGIYRDEWARLVDGEDFAGHSGALLGLAGRPNTNGKGLVITKVYDGEPAKQAGLREGDILVLFESKEVKSLDQLIALVGAELPGKVVTVEYVRSGQAQRMRIELGMRWD